MGSARSNIAESSFWQKYCERNSSCRQTIWAPLLAASTTLAAALSTFSRGSRPQRICTRPMVNLVELIAHNLRSARSDVKRYNRAVRGWIDGLLLVALALLPLHRPALHTGPNVCAADIVAGVALAAYLLLERLPRGAWLRVGVLIVTLAPSLFVAPDRPRAVEQLVGLVYVFLFSGAAWSLAERRQRDGLRAF